MNSDTLFDLIQSFKPQGQSKGLSKILLEIERQLSSKLDRVEFA
jgi:hypothetical protein